MLHYNYNLTVEHTFGLCLISYVILFHMINWPTADPLRYRIHLTRCQA